jgi:SAM-dependent methyltransferase
VFLFSARGASVRLALRPGVHPPDTYAPRFAAKIRLRPGDRVLDLGCGTGAFGLWAAKAGAGEAWLTDVCPRALACARANARRNRLANVRFAKGATFRPVRLRRFDVIVANLPQTPSPSPISPARWGGRDGARWLVRLAHEARRYLAKGGRVLFMRIGLSDRSRIERAFRMHGFRLRCLASARVPIERAEYDALRPGLWDNLLRLRRAGRAVFEVRGAAGSMRVDWLEAALKQARLPRRRTDARGANRQAPPTKAAAPEVGTASDGARFLHSP